jgi:hypothetical protein
MLAAIIGCMIPLVGFYRLYRNYADRRIAEQVRAAEDGDTEFDAYTDPWVLAPKTFFTRESLPDLVLIAAGWAVSVGAIIAANVIIRQ